MTQYPIVLLTSLLALATITHAAIAGDLPKVTLQGDWQIRIGQGEITSRGTRYKVATPALLSVDPPTIVIVQDEAYDTLPVYNPQAAGWAAGAALKGLINEETTAAGMLIPETVRIKKAAGNADDYVKDKDYAIETTWASVGRLAGGAISDNTKVWVNYSYGKGRLDSIIVDKAGKVSIRKGKPENALQLPAKLNANEALIANIWVSGRLAKLTDAELYPILAESYRVHKAGERSSFLPKTLTKLDSGKPLTVLAWGDSVTNGGAASDETHRYQNQFVALLKHKYPKSDITLRTSAWGGSRSIDFVNQPAGSEYSYKDKVLGSKPDLIVMEFVNDSYLTPEQVEKQYSGFLKDFQEIGAEWIIITPHFVRPDWMNAPDARVSQDPRPYVKALREFAIKHDVALADTSLRWGHLMSEGIPYLTLLANSINHPDDRGHEMFAQSLMELF
ncbi:MAG: SGNH/GDSL hydrolase family protein [Armatimonadota bacterium]